MREKNLTANGGDDHGKIRIFNMFHINNGISDALINRKTPLTVFNRELWFIIRNRLITQIFHLLYNISKI